MIISIEKKFVLDCLHASISVLQGCNGFHSEYFSSHRCFNMEVRIGLSTFCFILPTGIQDVEELSLIHSLFHSCIKQINY